MTPIYQAVVALAALISVVYLTAISRVNPDAAIAIIGSIIGYVFGVAVPVPASPIARLSPYAARDDGEISASQVLTLLLCVLVFILIVIYWPF